MIKIKAVHTNNKLKKHMLHKNYVSFIVAFLLFFISLYPNVLFAENKNNSQQNKILFKEDPESILRIKNINEFKFKQAKINGKTNRWIYTLKVAGKTQYLIKSQHKDKIISDFVGAFILRKIIGNRAPVNYIVIMENGKIALASQFIENFISVKNYLAELVIKDLKTVESIIINNTLTNKGLPPRCYGSDYLLSKKISEVALFSSFICRDDYNLANIGLIIKNGEIINSALVDFDSTLLSSKKNVWPGGYFSGIDQALQTLTRITSFDVDSLDILYPLFDKLDEKPALDKIKKLMHKRLASYKNKTKACTIAKKMMCYALY